MLTEWMNVFCEFFDRNASQICAVMYAEKADGKWGLVKNHPFPD
jgi:hypothetical protein